MLGHDLSSDDGPTPLAAAGGAPVAAVRRLPPQGSDGAFSADGLSGHSGARSPPLTEPTQHHQQRSSSAAATGAVAAAAPPPVVVGHTEFLGNFVLGHDYRRAVAPDGSPASVPAGDAMPPTAVYYPVEKPAAAATASAAATALTAVEEAAPRTMAAPGRLIGASPEGGGSGGGGQLPLPPPPPSEQQHPRSSSAGARAESGSVTARNINGNGAARGGSSAEAVTDSSVPPSHQQSRYGPSSQPQWPWQSTVVPRPDAPPSDDASRYSSNNDPGASTNGPHSSSGGGGGAGNANIINSSSSSYRNHGGNPSGGGGRYYDDADGYINIDDIPMQLSAMGRRNRPWHYGMCDCCHHCGPCTEVWACLPCQVSRQCNMFLHHEPSVHWPICLLITFTEVCTGCSFVGCLFVGQARRMARERYGLSGSGLSDCLAGCFCRCCALQQVLMEMTVMADFPGACCYRPSELAPQESVEMY